MPVQYSLAIILSILAVSIGASYLFPSKSGHGHGQVGDGKHHATPHGQLEDVGEDKRNVQAVSH